MNRICFLRKKVIISIANGHIWNLLWADLYLPYLGLGALIMGVNKSSSFYEEPHKGRRQQLKWEIYGKTDGPDRPADTLLSSKNTNSENCPFSHSEMCILTWCTIEHCTFNPLLIQVTPSSPSPDPNHPDYPEFFEDRVFLEQQRRRRGSSRCGNNHYR